MPKLNARLPKYRLHRHSGQAIVSLNGTDYYLGLHGTDASRAEYDRVVSEWLARGRGSELPLQAKPDEQPVGAGVSSVIVNSVSVNNVTVNGVILSFWEHAKMHYRKPDGTPTGELDNFRLALRPLRRLYGPTPAHQFGPKSLKAVREHMIGLSWCRSHINQQISRIKSVFRWAVENELVPPAVHHGLTAVKGLQRGRTDARESAPVKPVPEERIEAIKPFVGRQVWALIRLQLLTGARAGELIRMRGVDLKTGDKIWTLEPEQHKTAHHDHGKRIYFGPQAQAVLEPFLASRPLDAYLFSPAEAEVERLQNLHLARKTPLTYGNRPGTNRRSAPKRRPANCYTVSSYRQAIWRACDRAFPAPQGLTSVKVKGNRGLRRETTEEWKHRLGPEGWTQLQAWRQANRWHPHQLRHNSATYIRREFGIEVARIILGHRSASVTEIYAELDDQKARQVIRKIG